MREMIPNKNKSNLASRSREIFCDVNGLKRYMSKKDINIIKRFSVLSFNSSILV
jgi:hypothetical protein